MNKKFLFLLAILLLALAVFVACGDGNSTANPTDAPATSTVSPNADISEKPTADPTAEPTEEPTVEPTEEPTVEPTAEPTVEPTETPTLVNGKYSINYITEGLVAMYEGKYNTVDGLNTETSTWADLSGNGNDITDIEISEDCYFSEDGFYVDTQQVFLPDVILNTINADAFTVEMHITDLVSKGTTFNTFLNSSTNDNFALFTRQDNYLEFKSATNSRIKLAGEADKFDGHLISLTFDLDEGIAVAYCDGEYIGECEITMAIEAQGQMFIGHPSSEKNYSANWVSLRFYDRALTEDEIEHNASVSSAITIAE